MADQAFRPRAPSDKATTNWTRSGRTQDNHRKREKEGCPVEWVGTPQCRHNSADCLCVPQSDSRTASYNYTQEDLTESYVTSEGQEPRADNAEHVDDHMQNATWAETWPERHEGMGTDPFYQDADSKDSWIAEMERSYKAKYGEDCKFVGWDSSFDAPVFKRLPKSHSATRSVGAWSVKSIPNDGGWGAPVGYDDDDPWARRVDAGRRSRGGGSQRPGPQSGIKEHDDQTQGWDYRPRQNSKSMESATSADRERVASGVQDTQHGRDEWFRGPSTNGEYAVPIADKTIVPTHKAKDSSAKDLERETGDLRTKLSKERHKSESLETQLAKEKRKSEDLARRLNTIENEYIDPGPLPSTSTRQQSPSAVSLPRGRPRAPRLSTPAPNFTKPPSSPFKTKSIDPPVPSFGTVPEAKQKPSGRTVTGIVRYPGTKPTLVRMKEYATWDEVLEGWKKRQGLEREGFFLYWGSERLYGHENVGGVMSKRAVIELEVKEAVSSQGGW